MSENSNRAKGIADTVTDDKSKPVVVVVAGEDQSARSEAIQAALDEFSQTLFNHGGSGDDFGLFVERFEGSDSIDAALQSAATPSLTSQPRAVVVECQSLDVGVAERTRQWLSRFLDSEGLTVPPAIVVLCCERAPSEKVRSILEGCRVQYRGVQAPSYSGIPKLVSELGKEAGLNLTADAAAFLGSVVGSDVTALKSAIRQVADALPTQEGRARVERADVEQLFDFARHDPPWMLIQAVERSDVQTALLGLEGFLDRGYHPLQVLAMLYTSCRRIAYLASAPGLHKELLAAMNLPPAAKSRVSVLARKLGPSGARQLLAVLANAELDVKGRSGLDARIVLEKLVVSVSDLLGRSAESAGRRSHAKNRGSDLDLRSGRR